MNIVQITHSSTAAGKGSKFVQLVYCNLGSVVTILNETVMPANTDKSKLLRESGILQ